jgi:Asp-tRNA(Asn)/Glu-tRNA(Gln) amidotransferase B subunit
MSLVGKVMKQTKQKGDPILIRSEIDKYIKEKYE